jgi:hypothetical protein
MDLIEASRMVAANPCGRWNLWAAMRLFRRFPFPRRNNSLIRGANAPALGVRAWGDITMTDNESSKERRNQVARYRAMEQETNDPLAARLLRDIVLDLEAELERSLQSVSLDAA